MPYNLKKEIKDSVKEAVQEALADGCVTTQCPFTKEVAANIGHFFGMLSDVGNGDTRRGVEEVRESIRVLRCYRDFSKNIGSYVSKTMVVTLLTALIFVIWVGIKHYLGK